MGIDMLCRGSMLQALGLSLGLGLMASACSSSESMMGDSGYYPDAGLGPSDGGHGGSSDAGGGGMDSGMSPPHIERVSINGLGIQSNGFNSGSSLSADGRYVLFSSNGSNLVSGDSNGVFDLFVRDREFGSVERVSVGPAGVQGNGASGGGSMSSDARFVAFISSAANFIVGDFNSASDIFLRDRVSGITILVSKNPNGVPANGDSDMPAISGNGNRVVFSSQASDFGGDTNGVPDYFVYSRLTGAISRINPDLSTEGSGGFSKPSLNQDGQYVAFDSFASSLIVGDTNGALDVFRRDLQFGTNRRVSISSDGGESNGGGSASPSINADGVLIVFGSAALNLVTGDTNGVADIILRNLALSATERVSLGAGSVQANGNSFNPTINADGRFVAFESEASNLVSEDSNGVSDIFVRDRISGVTHRVSIGVGEVQGNAASYKPFISADGRFVAFESDASNLVSGDSNGERDIFVVSLDHFFGE